MDRNETATTELEARLRTHYKSVYSEPGTSSAVWEGIAGRLGGQEGRESVEFARSVDALYKPDAAGGPSPARVIGRRSRLDVVQRPTFLQPTWRPALAAGLVLALVAMLVTVMALTGRSGERTLPAVTPDDGSSDVVEQIAVKNPGFEEGFDGWVTDKHPYQDYSGGADSAVAHSGKASGYLKSIQ